MQHAALQCIGGMQHEQPGDWITSGGGGGAGQGTRVTGGPRVTGHLHHTPPPPPPPPSSEPTLVTITGAVS